MVVSKLCWWGTKWRYTYRRFSNAQVSENLEIIMMSI